MRPQGCHLPVLSAMTDNDAYVKMAIANVKVMETINELFSMLEGHLRDHSSREEVEAGKDELKRAKFEGAVAACEITALTAKNVGLEAFRDRDILGLLQQHIDYSQKAMEEF
ncbi:hypothetical protein F2Q69_00013172 [Brassica cretica]|uniref:Uncharacterized protein n=1 Tax=Brassica cretica TaxID=69181 RepID=A0A8S9QVH5_BRACR|nr:hypothetical protein F2Q69_00013172 [Brassica cretica]